MTVQYYVLYLFLVSCLPHIPTTKQQDPTQHSNKIFGLPPTVLHYFAVMLKLVHIVFCCYAIAIVQSQCGTQQNGVTECFAANCAAQNCSVKYDLTANFTFVDLDNDVKLCGAFNTAICSTVSCCTACSEEIRIFGECTLGASSQALKDCAFSTCGLNSGGGAAAQMAGTVACIIASILGLLGI